MIIFLYRFLDIHLLSIGDKWQSNGGEIYTHRSMLAHTRVLTCRQYTYRIEISSFLLEENERFIRQFMIKRKRCHLSPNRSMIIHDICLKEVLDLRYLLSYDLCIQLTKIPLSGISFFQSFRNSLVWLHSIPKGQ